MTNPTLPPCSVLVRLTREWEALGARPAVLARARSWDLGVPLHSLGDLLVATGMQVSAAARAERHGREPADRAAGERANALLCRLVVVARRDDLAARAVLQRLLPGLLAVARRRSRGMGPGDAAVCLEDLVAAAWSVIRTFPVERRRVHVAAQLLRDAEYHVFVRPFRRVLVQQPLTPERLEVVAPPTFDAAEADPRAELAELAAAAVLSDHDRRLLALLIAGRPVPEVARELEVSERTVRYHRDAVVHRLRQAAVALAAA